MKDKKQMSFMAHIGEMRGHLIRIIIAIAVGAIVTAIFWDWVVDTIITGPLRSSFWTYQAMNEFVNIFGIGPVFPDEFDIQKELFNPDPSGQLTAQLIALIVLGMVVAIPYIVWEIWRFIAPALTPKEQKNTRGFVLATTIFFLLGITFSYFILLPLSTQFLYFYQPFGVANEWRLPKYINLFVQTLIGMGIVFLFPIFVYFLTKIGLITPKFLQQYRKHAFLVIMVIAAIITPSDLISMFVAAVPLWVLYEFSIIVSRIVFNRQVKEAKAVAKP